MHIFSAELLKRLSAATERTILLVDDDPAHRAKILLSQDKHVKKLPETDTVQRPQPVNEPACNPEKIHLFYQKSSLKYAAEICPYFP